MLAGAICAWLIWSGFTGLQKTWNHKGPGMVWDPDAGSHMESEAQYKRYYYVEYGFLLALGIYGWIGILRAEAKMAKKRPPL